MPAAAEVGEAAGRVEGDRLARFDDAVDELGLERVLGKAVARILGRGFRARHVGPGREKLAHRRFELGKLGLARRALAPEKVEIVIKAGVGRGADGRLCVRIALKDGGSEEMRQRVALRGEGIRCCIGGYHIKRKTGRSFLIVRSRLAGQGGTQDLACVAPPDSNRMGQLLQERRCGERELVPAMHIMKESLDCQ